MKIGKDSQAQQGTGKRGGGERYEIMNNLYCEYPWNFQV